MSATDENKLRDLRHVEINATVHGEPVRLIIASTARITEGNAAELLHGIFWPGGLEVSPAIKGVKVEQFKIEEED